MAKSLNRTTLHKDQLPLFKEYLERNGYVYENKKGNPILSFEGPKRANRHTMIWTNAKNSHLTVEGPNFRLVQQFKRDLYANAKEHGSNDLYDSLSALSRHE